MKIPLEIGTYLVVKNDHHPDISHVWMIDGITHDEGVFGVSVCLVRRHPMGPTDHLKVGYRANTTEEYIINNCVEIDYTVYLVHES